MRFFVKCQLFFYGSCFGTILQKEDEEEKGLNALLWTSDTFDSGFSIDPNWFPWREKSVTFISNIVHLSWACFFLLLKSMRNKQGSFIPYVLLGEATSDHVTPKIRNSGRTSYIVNVPMCGCYNTPIKVSKWPWVSNIVLLVIWLPRLPSTNHLSNKTKDVEQE